MNPPLIELIDVHKRFGENRVLCGVNLAIARGRVFAVIGKRGSGKSVLLKLMAGRMAPDSGQVLFNGRPLDAMDAAGKKAMGKQMSWVFPGAALFDDMTVFENIALALHQGRKRPFPGAEARVRSAIGRLALKGREGAYPPALSGIEKKQVALARALVTGPGAVFFDEPAAGLDPMGKNAVYSMIAERRQHEGFTGVVACREISEIQMIARRVAVLFQGKIPFEGEPEKLFGSSDPASGALVRGLDCGRDRLTGLDSRPRAERTFLRERARFQRHRTPFSIVLLCVENMAEMSREMGHEAGQGALKQFAEKVRKHVRVSDSCARSGMDRILLILPNTELGQARRVCAKLAQGLKSEESGIDPAPGALSLSVSAGFAQAETGSRLDDLLSRAGTLRTQFYDFYIQ